MERSCVPVGVDLTVNTLFVRFTSVFELMIEDVCVRIVQSGICLATGVFGLTVYICWVFGLGGLILTNWLFGITLIFCMERF